MPRKGGSRAGRTEAAPRRATTGKRRALGQHFLRDPDVATRIVDLLAPTGRDLVLEIGPGEGALTFELARRTGRVLALELDRALAERLGARLATSPHVEVRVADALRFDYETLVGGRPDPGGRVLVAGNLPYSVGTAILGALLDAAPAIVAAAPMEMAVMLQREVAERVAAGPGSRAYGSLSVVGQLAADVTLAFLVPPGAFRPPPQVESAVLHLRARRAPPVAVADRAALEQVVRAAFSQRRKTLANALAAGLRLSPDQARTALTAAGIDPLRRAETLSLEEFARLAVSLSSPRRGSG